jgi:hypothetical protein
LALWVSLFLPFRVVAKEVDEDAPTQWKAMVASNFPEEFYERLGAAEKKVVDSWTEKRSILLHSMVSKSIVDSMKNATRHERTSLPYVRMLVRAFSHLKQKGRHPARAEQKTAELTVWRVSDEQLNRMKEGTVLRMKNLGVKADRDGRLQLSAKADTKMEPLSSVPTQYELIRSGYEERRPTSLVRITLMSKNPGPNRLAREVDIVACIVKIVRMDDNTSYAYLTDSSGFVMKLVRTHRLHNNDPFQLGNVETFPAVVAFCNLEVTSFDTMEQCALGTWGISSCKAKHPMHLRWEEMHAWCTSASGVEHCTTILDRINTGIPICAGPFNRFRVCLGYVLGFDETNSDLMTYGMTMVIDYGEKFPLTARLPIHLFSNLIQLAQSNSMTDVIGSSSSAGNMFDTGDILSSYSSFSDYFQRNQTLFRFSLEIPSCYGDELQVPRVIGISIANVDSLTRLHLT